MQYKTLGELRAELQARLGFAAAGSQAGINLVTINSFLQNAQDQLYWNHDWRHLIKRDDKLIGIGQQTIAYPDDAHTERILDIQINLDYYAGGNVWVPVRRGIEPRDYDVDHIEGRPVAVDLFDQVYISPRPDKQYIARFWYMKALPRFTEDNDRCAVDSSIVFLHALVNGKAHYKHADKDVYASQLETILQKMKTKAPRREVFSVNSDPIDTFGDTYLRQPPQTIR